METVYCTLFFVVTKTGNVISQTTADVEAFIFKVSSIILFCLQFDLVVTLLKLGGSLDLLGRYV
jgi:hypothetical protein